MTRNEELELIISALTIRIINTAELITDTPHYNKNRVREYAIQIAGWSGDIENSEAEKD